MKKRVNFLTVSLFALLIVFSFLSTAMAQKSYPTQPIELIIPWAAGSVTDLGARFFAEKWSEFLGQPFIPINKVGGGGMIASKFVANAKPDGYTLLIATSGTISTSRVLRKDAGFDLDSFRIICQWGMNPLLYCVKADSKWDSMNKFLQDAKQNPGKLRCAALMGSTLQYAVEMLARAAGVRLTLVPFKSTPEGLTALIGGHLEMAVAPGLGGMKKSPDIRVLAVAEEERLSGYPDAPTLKELGYPVLIETMLMLCGPKDLPEEIANALADAHRKAFVKYGKEMKEKMSNIDIFPRSVDGKMTGKMLREFEKEFKEWAIQAGIKTQ
jgi:tripartite-type tricarboxylate transporter receptor subunit TctC